MIVLTIRTDKPEAEIGIYKDSTQLSYETWQAHRALAETLHSKIRDLLQQNDLQPPELNGIVCYKGPGSFTGLRIGLTVANAMSYAFNIPIVSETTEEWQHRGIDRLQKGDNEKIAMPEYGAEVHITQQKH